MTSPRIALTLAALALAAAGCASIELNPALEGARAEVNAAASNPDVLARAPLELRMAQDSLARAERFWQKRESAAEVSHHAYLARVRAITAQDLARARRATDEIAAAQAETERLRIALRTREAEIAQSQALRDRHAADAARADAARAQQEAAEAARLAADERARAARALADAEAARRRLATMETRIVEIEGRKTERGILVTLGDVLFEFDRAELLPTAAPRLDKLADFLKQFPEKKLLIEGYTDSIGTDRYNLELSHRRAEAVRAALLARGVDPSRMVAEGYGEQFPVADNKSTSGRQLNRRVEVVVSDEQGNLKPRTLASR